MESKPFSDPEICEAIDRYADVVYRLAFSRTGSRSDADDIFQEVFLRYIRKNPAFESEEHRKAWLIKVTLNCSKKLFSSAFRRRQSPLLEEAFFAVPAGDPQDAEILALREALCRLPQKYRTVLYLFYYEDLQTDAIAQVLNLTPSAVRSRLTRGRRMLKEQLKGEF